MNRAAQTLTDSAYTMQLAILLVQMLCYVHAMIVGDTVSPSG